MVQVSQLTLEELDGAAPYTPGLLRVYDRIVLGINNKVVWRCETTHLLDQYSRLSSAVHLDIGPGTGDLLERAPLGAARTPVVELVDLSVHALEEASRRLRKRGIEARAHYGSVLGELPVNQRFRSVAASLLMHCLPGTWSEKGRAFQRVADVTSADGVFFGATVLAEPSTPLSRAVDGYFRAHKAFDNARDDLDGLRYALDRAWSDVSVTRVGQTALWTARGPRRST
ncbi:class I SAM-dependent methyltransferase [Nocardia sp. CS682]|uniref:class I SAM-dependent methyltransferase n=1 Tax=Nocardia sp. CS682 TaxID=1047172 RepID=UPI0010752259|nr:class I SAM-dependent methyltransferase [Nocardia sp. CS682]